MCIPDKAPRGNDWHDLSALNPFGNLPQNDSAFFDPSLRALCFGPWGPAANQKFSHHEHHLFPKVPVSPKPAIRWLKPNERPVP